MFQEKNGVPNLLAREFPFFDVPDVIENQLGRWRERRSQGTWPRCHPNHDRRCSPAPT
jgi:hypothetical protein